MPSTSTGDLVMINTTKLLRIVPLAVALAFASLGGVAQAQTAASSSTPPGANGPAERAENAGKRAVNATERGVKRAGRATKRAGSRAAGAVRNTGDKISSKLPPAPNDSGLNGQGIPREPKQ